MIVENMEGDASSVALEPQGPDDLLEEMEDTTTFQPDAQPIEGVVIVGKSHSGSGNNECLMPESTDSDVNTDTGAETLTNDPSSHEDSAAAAAESSSAEESPVDLGEEDTAITNEEQLEVRTSAFVEVIKADRERAESEAESNERLPSGVVDPGVESDGFVVLSDKTALEAEQLRSDDKNAQPPVSVLATNADYMLKKTKSIKRRVSFSDSDQIREFHKTALELAAERAIQEEAFQAMRNKWKNKSSASSGRYTYENKATTTNTANTANDDDPHEAARTPDFREERHVVINRGQELKSLGIDLTLKPAEKPNNGLVATIRGVDPRGVVAHQASNSRSRLRKGDRILKVYDKDLCSLEAGEFLAMLAQPRLELLVFNVIEAENKLANFEREKRERELNLYEQRKKLDQLKLERANKNLLQEKLDVVMMQNWVNHFTERLAMAPQRRKPPPTKLKKEDIHKIVRTVYLDRRLDPHSNPSHDGLDRDEYFKPRELCELQPLGLSLYIRRQLDKEGHSAGTFAVITEVANDGLTANSGRGKDQIWPDDRIIRIQGRKLSEIDPDNIFKFINVRRVELVVANVNQYQNLTREPDLIDQIGGAVDMLKANLNQAAAKAKALWEEKKGSLFKAVPTFGNKSPPADTQSNLTRDNLRISMTSPIVRSTSSIISPKNWCPLWDNLPRRMQFKEAHLAFTTSVDGYSLQLLYSRTCNVAPFIIVIETKNGAKFGAYMTDPLMMDLKNKDALDGYRGSGESFVFQLNPSYKCFEWVGARDDVLANDAPAMFLHCNADRIAIGGGGPTHAIEIDDDLHHGTSGHCTTYDNLPLTSEKDFECVALEYWGFSENVDI